MLAGRRSRVREPTGIPPALRGNGGLATKDNLVRTPTRKEGEESWGDGTSKGGGGEFGYLSLVDSINLFIDYNLAYSDTTGLISNFEGSQINNHDIIITALRNENANGPGSSIDVVTHNVTVGTILSSS